MSIYCNMRYNVTIMQHLEPLAPASISEIYNDIRHLRIIWRNNGMIYTPIYIGVLLISIYHTRYDSMNDVVWIWMYMMVCVYRQCNNTQPNAQINVYTVLRMYYARIYTGICVLGARGVGGRVYICMVTHNFLYKNMSLSDGTSSSNVKSAPLWEVTSLNPG